MLLGTFQSGDFFQKPELKDKSWIPSDLFNGDASHGIAWCFPITKDRVFSLVNAWMCCPNFADHFIVLDTDDYHRIDKFKWYKYIYDHSDVSSVKDCFKFIDDSLSDDKSEFIVPYAEFNYGLLAACPFTMSDDSGKSDSILFYPDAYSVGFDSINRSLFPYCKKWYSSDYRTSLINSDDKMFEQRIRELKFFRIFSFFYLPLVFTILINTYYLHEPFEKLSFPTVWGEYADLYFEKFCLVQNRFSHWANGGKFEISEWGSIRDEFANLLVFDTEIFKARLYGLGRNELCPCGSGKKFKKCHGRGFC